MAQQMVDRNGHRWGAGISATVLLVAFVLQWAAVVPAAAAALAVGVTFGPRYSPLGAAYRALKSLVRLDVPVEPEPAAPPRFAQLLGMIFLGLSTVFLFVGDVTGLGWTFALLVAGLQALLAATGICIGCEIYLYGKRFTAKEA